MYIHVNRTFYYSPGGCPDQRRLSAGSYRVGDGVSARLAAVIVQRGYGTFSKYAQHDKARAGPGETQVIRGATENK